MNKTISNFEILEWIDKLNTKNFDVFFFNRQSLAPIQELNNIPKVTEPTSSRLLTGADIINLDDIDGSVF